MLTELKNIGLERIENGLIVNFDYRMTDEARKKARNKGCYDSYREPEKYTFKTVNEVVDFVAKELRKLK